MWFGTILEGIEFGFRICGYGRSTAENRDSEWCKVDLRLKARDWLDYRVDADELMLCAEVRQLRDALGALLSGAAERPRDIECLEPDLEFRFCTKEDSGMDLTVNFWNVDGGLTGNRIILHFTADDLGKLYCYLGYVTGAVDETDAEIKRLMAEGSIYDKE